MREASRAGAPQDSNSQTQETPMKRLEPTPRPRQAAAAKPLPTRVHDRRPGVSFVPLRSGPLRKLAWIFGIER
jgi:hypothetical protein